MLVAMRQLNTSNSTLLLGGIFRSLLFSHFCLFLTESQEMSPRLPTQCLPRHIGHSPGTPVGEIFHSAERHRLQGGPVLIHASIHVIAALCTALVESVGVRLIQDVCPHFPFPDIGLSSYCITTALSFFFSLLCGLHLLRPPQLNSLLKGLQPATPLSPPSAVGEL